MFPLYNSLNKNIPNKNLTITQKNEFIKKIETIDNEGHSLIFALIKSYYNDEEKDNSQIPYQGKVINNNIEYNLSDLPAKLQQILYKFISLHISRMEEASQSQAEL